MDAGNGVRTSGRGLLGRTRRTERPPRLCEGGVPRRDGTQLFEEIDPSLPRAERRAVVHDRVSVLSWSFVANFLITVSEIVDLLNERGGSYGGALLLGTLR